jgi:hypothetical protein
MSTNTKKGVSFNPLATSAPAHPDRHEKQTTQERMQALRELRKNGMDEPASPRTIYNTWKNDNGAYGGRKTKKRRKNRNKKRTNKRQSRKR